MNLPFYYKSSSITVKSVNGWLDHFFNLIDLMMRHEMVLIGFDNFI